MCHTLVDSCNVVIAASTAIILTWEQVKAALETLINFCVENPSRPSVGGAAHYALHPPGILGRRRNKKRVGKVTGIIMAWIKLEDLLISPVIRIERPPRTC